MESFHLQQLHLQSLQKYKIMCALIYRLEFVRIHFLPVYKINDKDHNRKKKTNLISWATWAEDKVRREVISAKLIATANPFYEKNNEENYKVQKLHLWESWQNNSCSVCGQTFMERHLIDYWHFSFNGKRQRCPACKLFKNEPQLFCGSVFSGPKDFFPPQVWHISQLLSM